MKHLQYFLEKVLKKRKIYTEAKASYILEKMRQILQDNLGKDFEKFVKLHKFYEKNIYIKCNTSSWKHLLTQHKKSFLYLLQLEFSKKEIENIIIS